MKKIKITSIRHISSVGLTLLFCLLSVASIPIDFLTPPKNTEGPCELLPPTSLTYKCTITVKDKFTGARIPNATVNLLLWTSSSSYLGDSKCIISPVKHISYNATIQTNASGVAFYEFTNVILKTNIDNSILSYTVNADNFTNDEGSVLLSPLQSTVTIDVQIIDLSTEP